MTAHRRRKARPATARAATDSILWRRTPSEPGGAGRPAAPGNAAANTAADHQTVLDLALAQIRPARIGNIEHLVRADTAGATHELADHCHEGNMRFSFGYELTESVRAAIL